MSVRPSADCSGSGLEEVVDHRCLIMYCAIRHYCFTSSTVLFPYDRPPHSGPICLCLSVSVSQDSMIGKEKARCTAHNINADREGGREGVRGLLTVLSIQCAPGALRGGPFLPSHSHSIPFFLPSFLMPSRNNVLSLELQ